MAFCLRINNNDYLIYSSLLSYDLLLLYRIKKKVFFTVLLNTYILFNTLRYRQWSYYDKKYLIQENFNQQYLTRIVCFIIS